MAKKHYPKGVKTFTSFEELRPEFGLKPIRFQTKDKKKLESQRENFESKHVCPACKQKMKFILGTNIMTCMNPECKGIKREIVDPDTEEKRVSYITPSHQVDERSAVIAQNIFTNY